MNNHLKLAWQRLIRSPYQAASAISLLTMTLFLAGVFIILAAGSEAVLRHFETQPQINAFFAADYVPPPQEIDRISSQLQATGLVDSVKYVSKEDALAIYKQLNQSDPLLLEAVTANILPASLEVTATHPRSLKILADLLKQESKIDDVRFAEDIVANISRWTTSLRLVGISLVSVHLVISFSIILLIIGLKVRSRSEEIHVLQLIGASTGYIAAPFVWEGIIYGLVSAVVAWLSLFIILLYSMGFWVSFLAGIPILPPPVWFLVALGGGLSLTGMAVGGLGGAIAAHRFLKS